MSHDRKIRQLVVHCAATYPSMDIDAAWIDREHRLRGFSMIGYHYFIKRDGTIQTGRTVDKIGAHVKGHNSQSIGICLAGGLIEKGKKEVEDDWEDNFAPIQMDSLRTLLTQLHALYPGAEVLGHRDFPGVAKICPSFDVKSWWLEGHNSVPENNRMDD